MAQIKDAGDVITRLMRMSRTELTNEAQRLLKIPLSEMDGKNFTNGVTMHQYRFMVMSELEACTPIDSTRVTWNKIRDQVLVKNVERL